MYVVSDNMRSEIKNRYANITSECMHLLDIITSGICDKLHLKSLKQSFLNSTLGELLKPF